MDEVYELTPSEAVRVLRSEVDALEVEGNWGPQGSPPPKHFHPEQDERFEVTAGVLRARVDGREHTLRAGDVLEVPRGAVHQMWNEGNEPARAIWRTAPAGRTPEWFKALSDLRRSGRVGRDGMPGPLAFGVLLTEFRDVFRLAGPQPLVAPAVRMLGTVGRLRGHAVPR